MVNRVALVLVGLALGAPSLQAQGSGRQMTVPVSKEPLLDMGSYANPLPATDELWIERLTELEVRDAIRAGKTSVLIPTGSVENNGPWLTMNKHNDVLRVCADSVARRMGNMLVAPISRRPEPQHRRRHLALARDLQRRPQGRRHQPEGAGLQEHFLRRRQRREP